MGNKASRVDSGFAGMDVPDRRINHKGGMPKWIPSSSTDISDSGLGEFQQSIRNSIKNYSFIITWWQSVITGRNRNSRAGYVYGHAAHLEVTVGRGKEIRKTGKRVIPPNYAPVTLSASDPGQQKLVIVTNRQFPSPHDHGFVDAVWQDNP